METSAKRKDKQQFRKTAVNRKFRNFILKNDHPCIMAQTVFKMDKVEIKSYSNFGSKNTGERLLEDIKTYLENYNFDLNDFYTFIAVFPEETQASEIEFERLLWKQLKNIHKADNEPWDEAVSNDPENNDFSFSIAGKAFYVVGMHPNSSRKSRQAPYATLTFNLHCQFEKLRQMGAYQNVRNKIRERDTSLQGGINPMLEDFGENSEAKQYSGRKVGKEWKCPFLHHKK